MKILVVHNYYRRSQPSGENASFTDETTLLESRGCDVERLEVESDQIATWPLRKRALTAGRVVWSRPGIHLVENAIRRFEPDVVHFHNTFPLLSPAVLRAAHKERVPVIVTLRNFRPFCANGTFLRDGNTCEICVGARVPVAAVRYGCYRDSRLATLPVAAMIATHRQLHTWTNSADAILFPSVFARDKYRAAGWPEGKLFVKPNVVRAMGPVRQGGGTGFVSMSRLSREKGLGVLIDAWRRAFPRGEETLTIIGSGDDEAALKAQASDCNGIRFVGALPRADAASLLAQARALVMPSICQEFFGRTVVEAYSVGVPVIASRAGALPELVEDGRTGVLVDPGSVDQVAEALTRMSVSPTLATDLGRNARSAYVDRFGPEATTDALLSLYEKTIAAPQPSEDRHRVGVSA